MLDERWIRSLHVESMRRAELHRERDPHVLFQASTVGALLDGGFEGDLSFAELAEHGDLGLGTLNHLDGEMIALDGEFFRADVDGRLNRIAPEARTPFAVVTRFDPEVDVRLPDEELDHDSLLERLDALVPAGASSCAIRLDGRFAAVRARSVPRQEPPYRPLTEVVADQHVFELTDVEGTIVGFRFPAYVEGIEVAGYHLHFASADRSRGGHVLGSRSRGLRARLDPSNDLHVELPPRVELADPDLAAETHAAVEAVEGG
ncbi:MAG TPA: acetolactate decarboxylase [Solirubrobacterales bacterium]|jgi:acetolactate decarboxylase|nr:acetolactate decarboxylase [Solirubrobacterales bacterium]